MGTKEPRRLHAQPDKPEAEYNRPNGIEERHRRLSEANLEERIETVGGERSERAQETDHNEHVQPVVLVHHPGQGEADQKQPEKFTAHVAHGKPTKPSWGIHLPKP